MSKISLSSNVSGTGVFTISSPNSNTNRTITLPDADGEISLGGTPVGTLIYFAASTPPTGFVKANGAAVSRTTYADLFAVIGTNWGVGNGSTTFNLPDLRGEFVRGWDDARGVDSGRSFASAQADELESHRHRVWGLAGGPIAVVGSQTRSFMGGQSGNWTDGYGGNHIENTGGTETRPRNIAALACIKY